MGRVGGEGEGGEGRGEGKGGERREGGYKGLLLEWLLEKEVVEKLFCESAHEEVVRQVYIYYTFLCMCVCMDLIDLCIFRCNIDIFYGEVELNFFFLGNRNSKISCSTRSLEVFFFSITIIIIVVVVVVVLLSNSRSSFCNS